MKLTITYLEHYGKYSCSYTKQGYFIDGNYYVIEGKYLKRVQNVIEVKE